MVTLERARLEIAVCLGIAGGPDQWTKDELAKIDAIVFSGFFPGLKPELTWEI
jgi:hypothetical protein